MRNQEDDWPRVEARHRLDDFAREQSPHTSGKRVTADADQGRRLEIFDGRDDLRALARRVEMIEGFAGWQLVRVGQLVRGKAGPPRDHQSLGIEHTDLLPGCVGRNALLAQRRDNQVGEADGGGAGAEKEDPLLFELAAGDLERIDQARQRDAARA